MIIRNYLNARAWAHIYCTVSALPRELFLRKQTNQVTSRLVPLDAIVLLVIDLPIDARRGGRWLMMSSNIKQ